MYEVVPEIHSGEEYGLGVYQTYALRAPSGYVVHDITTYARRLEGFASRLNRFHASEIHLLDLIYDFIA